VAKNIHRILIVDDEPDTCANLSDILTDLGFQVDTAYDGFAALELVKKKAYDLALLDLRMPGMDGLELYRRMREISAGTVAIVVTAYAASDTAKSIIAAGAWRIVPKPVNIGSLLGLVAQALDTPLILVVDDDRDLCENLWDVLRERGYRVHFAHDVVDAERALAQRKFHVVLIDMKLPTGDGQQVLQALHEFDREARAILITGFAAEMETKVQKALQAGANAVCYKPFDVERLLSTVQQLCTQSSQTE
jgi:two-component system, NtrC family, response regulator HydG